MYIYTERDKPWDFFGRNDAKAETPVLWPLHVKSWLIGEDSDAGRDWGQEEKGLTEDEMAGWHHWLNGHEFEWTPRVGVGQGGLACCDSWGRKESDMTERLNCIELMGFQIVKKSWEILIDRVKVKFTTKYWNQDIWMKEPRVQTSTLIFRVTYFDKVFSTVHWGKE